MTRTQYIGMDVHMESISIAVMNSVGKVVMECVIETKASTILQFIQGLRGDSSRVRPTSSTAAKRPNNFYPWDTHRISDGIPKDRG
jgi:hypothetical protein